MMRDVGRTDRNRGRKENSQARYGRDPGMFEGKKVVDCRQGGKKGVVQVEIRELGLRW